MINTSAVKPPPGYSEDDMPGDPVDKPSPVALEKLCEPGWAVVQEGVLLVKTVSPTRRAAIVNWIVTEAKQLVLQSWNDKKIEKVWNKRNIDAQVIEVAIAARTALPKALAEIADWKNVVEGQRAIIERVTRERDDALTNLDVLASAFKKFAPDLADELTRRWKDGTGDPLLAALAASTLSAAPEPPKALAERLVEEAQTKLRSAEELRDRHFKELKHAQTIIDDLAAFRERVLTTGVSSELIGVILSEDARIDNGALANIEFLAVKIAVAVEAKLTRDVWK